MGAYPLAMPPRKAAVATVGGAGFENGMTEGSASIRERASREATEWLIRLQEEPDDPEVSRRFSAWLKASPTHAAAWAATQQVAGTIAAAPPSCAATWQPFVARRRAQAGDGKPEPRAPRPPRAALPRPDAVSNGPRRRPVVVAALAAAVCLAVVLVPDLLLRLKADYTTAVAEVRTLHLDDGSTIVLAPDSAIAVAYGASERRVSLLSGEAYFEVTTDPQRPFHVSTDEIETRVLGTSFNVLKEDDGATVALQHGGVRVFHETASPPVSEVLGVGEFVRVTWTGDFVRGAMPPSQIAAWREGQLIVQDQSVETVVDRLRRYYRGTIVLADRDLAGRPVTGVYNLADPLEALGAIARAHGATLRRITPWIVVISRI